MELSLTFFAGFLQFCTGDCSRDRFRCFFRLLFVFCLCLKAPEYEERYNPLRLCRVAASEISTWSFTSPPISKCKARYLPRYLAARRAQLPEEKSVETSEIFSLLFFTIASFVRALIQNRKFVHVDCTVLVPPYIQLKVYE